MVTNTHKKSGKRKNDTSIPMAQPTPTPPITPTRRTSAIDPNTSPLKKSRQQKKPIIKRFESLREWILSTIHVKIWKVSSDDTGNLFVYMNTGKQILCSKIRENHELEIGKVYELKWIIKKKNSIVFTDRTDFVEAPEYEINDIHVPSETGKIVLKTNYFSDTINVMLQPTRCLIFSVNKDFDVFQKDHFYEISFLKEASGNTLRIAQSTIYEEADPIQLPESIITTPLNKVSNSDVGFYFCKAVISNLLYGKDFFRNSIKVQLSDKTGTIETGLYNENIPKVLRVNKEMDLLEHEEFRDLVKDVTGKEVYCLLKKAFNKKKDNKDQENSKQKNRNHIYYLHHVIYSYEDTELFKSFNSTSNN